MAKMSNNEYLKSYLSIMASVNDDDDKKEKDDEEDVVVKQAKKKKEKEKGDKEYNNAVKSLGAMTSYLRRYNETNDSKYVSGILEKLFPPSYKIYDQMFHTPEEFVLALSEIYNLPGGAIAIGYALRTLVTKSKDILPIHAESYAKGVVTLTKVIEELIEYGVKNGLYEIDPEDAKIMTSNHKEAAMEAEEVKEKEVEKESASDKKKDKKKKDKEEDEKKKKEREAREAAREAAKQWIDFDEMRKMDCFKDDNESFYRVANRIAKLFSQDQVKDMINGKKFTMLHYQNKDEFVIQSSDNLILFWFKPDFKATPYSIDNIDQFNQAWAKEHAPEPQQLSA